MAVFMVFLAYRDILWSIEAGKSTIFSIFNYISEMVKKELYTIKIMHEAFILDCIYVFLANRYISNEMIK